MSIRPSSQATCYYVRNQKWGRPSPSRIDQDLLCKFLNAANIKAIIPGSNTLEVLIKQRILPGTSTKLKFTMAPTSAARLTCLCGNISVPGSILESSELPMPLKICHCNFCRHITGSLSLGLAFPPLSASPPAAILARLTAYKESKKSTVYFCPTVRVPRYEDI